MDNVITSLTTDLSATQLWGTVGSIIPFVIVTTLFALGFYLVKRALNKAKKAKGGI